MSALTRSMSALIERAILFRIATKIARSPVFVSDGTLLLSATIDCFDRLLLPEDALSCTAATAIIDRLDTNGDGKLDKDESDSAFDMAVKMLASGKDYIDKEAHRKMQTLVFGLPSNPEKMDMAFGIIDQDNNGKATKTGKIEFKEVHGKFEILNSI